MAPPQRSAAKSMLVCDRIYKLFIFFVILRKRELYMSRLYLFLPNFHFKNKKFWQTTQASAANTLNSFDSFSLKKRISVVLSIITIFLYSLYISANRCASNLFKRTQSLLFSANLHLSPAFQTFFKQPPYS